MLIALVLVCSLGVTPDLQASNRTNAIDVLRVSEAFSNPVMCLMYGQAFSAGTVIGRQLAADNRVKVMCISTAKFIAVPAGASIRQSAARWLPPTDSDKSRHRRFVGIGEMRGMTNGARRRSRASDLASPSGRPVYDDPGMI